MSKSVRTNPSLRNNCRVIGIVIALLAVLVPIQPAGAVLTDVLDQSSEGTFNAVNDVVTADTRQTFTAGMDGPLSRVEVLTSVVQGAAPKWTAEILTVNANGVPTATVLATANLPATPGSGIGAWLSFTFDNPVIITKGNQYALRIKAFDAPSGTVGWRGSQDNPYAEGQLYIGEFNPGSQRDNFFRTYVQVDVPDTTPPVIIPKVTGTLGANEWYTSDVTVNWEVTDPEAPITESTGCEAVAIRADTAGMTFNCSATSEGGTASRSLMIKRDDTPPAITGARAPTANHHGWNNSDVTVSFTCSDLLSGIQSCPQNTILNADTVTGAQFVEGAAVDRAGNQASVSVGPIMIDRLPPSLSGAPTTSPNAAGWYNGDVTIAWTCADQLSGIDGSCPANSTITGEGTGLSVNSHVLDRAGNLTAASSNPWVYIDRTPPSVGVTGVADGASYLVGAVPSAACTTTDGLSGVASNATLSVSGGNSGGVGLFTATCGGAQDRAGNSAQASVTYMVGYVIEGFASPVDNDILNVAKAGQTLPLKWRLLDANGAPVTDLGAANVKVFVQSLSCSAAGSTTDAIEEYASGGSGLQNLGDGYYQFNWTSPKSYANSCKTLYLDLAPSAVAPTTAEITIKLDAGLMKSAMFQFKK